MANPSITRLSLKKNGFDYEHETKAALMRIAAAHAAGEAAARGPQPAP